MKKLQISRYWRSCTCRERQEKPSRLEEDESCASHSRERWRRTEQRASHGVATQSSLLTGNQGLSWQEKVHSATNVTRRTPRGSTGCTGDETQD